MFAALLPALAFAAAAALAQNSTSDVTQAFIHANLVPDVLPSFNPGGLLSVVYTNNATGGTIDVTPGKNLTVQDVLLRPQVSLTSDNSTLANETFVLVLVDPDAPTPQNTSAAQIRHILAGGLRPNGSLADGTLLVKSTPAVSDYLNPNPPAGSDPHRYTVLLYVQPENFDIEVSRFVNASTPIFGFNVSVFAQELGLGSPVAGNFFIAGPASNSSAAQSITASSGASATTQSQSSSGLTSASIRSIGIGLVIALRVVLIV
ncbi:PEBP-like protein [Polyporus arcularius HHB13444]|uniref:PEBP-like protein n=1 Tax=Polyporus arcularius HHB13444 TaxID=1314778 RepID=A0A5C3PV56_9APHY|nr:PEBP-like protein [Polyporus arcularius HHB13444]